MSGFSRDSGYVRGPDRCDRYQPCAVADISDGTGPGIVHACDGNGPGKRAAFILPRPGKKYQGGYMYSMGSAIGGRSGRSQQKISTPGFEAYDEKNKK
jgi:hypothetical protein